MRKCMLIPMLLVTVCSFAQSPSSDTRSSGRMIARSSLGPVIEDETFRKKFIAQQWSPGTVMFKSSPIRYPQLLIFDEFNNKLYFYKDGNIMEYNQPVKEFTIMLIKNGDSTDYVFRSAYPEINKNTQETFYQVMVDGDYQLLKCTAKTNLLYKDEDLPEEKRNPIKEMLYAALPGNKIAEIKKDKDYIITHLPGYAETIQKVVVENKIKLNKEKSLIKLFELLNK